ncbi:MAG: hypothetical protein VYC95_06235, partial [Verrucomicrobiota bacterium]|nr:hypothetical protein [Verrucomicrobiota bacterium]
GELNRRTGPPWKIFFTPGTAFSFSTPLLVVVQVKPLTIQVCCGGEMVPASTRMLSCSCAAFWEDLLAAFRAVRT